MKIDAYNIGLVVSPQGLNENQARWMDRWLRYTVKALADSVVERKVHIVVPGFSATKETNYGLPRTIWNRALPAGVDLRIEPMPFGNMKSLETLLRLSHLLHDTDEVWCCPAGGQTGRLTRTRPGVVFWAAMDKLGSQRYKWVPPWVEYDLPPVIKPKEKKHGRA